MKIKKITSQWLKEHKACSEAIEAWEAWISKKKDNPINILNTLIKTDEKEKLKWANWLIVKLFSYKKQKVQYAIFATELVLHIFEKEYPNDKRPRKAIEAAKKYLKKQSQKNKKAADTAADVAYAAHAAYADAYADAYAAYAAAYAAHADAYAAYADAYAAYADADYAKTYNETLIKIIKYGIKLFVKE